MGGETQFQFINASSAVPPACALRGSVGKTYDCGPYVLSNITGVTALNGSCVEMAAGGKYVNVVGDAPLQCGAARIQVSGSSPTNRPLLKIAVVVLVLAQLVVAASAGGPLPAGALQCYYKGKDVTQVCQDQCGDFSCSPDGFDFTLSCLGEQNPYAGDVYTLRDYDCMADAGDGPFRCAAYFSNDNGGPREAYCSVDPARSVELGCCGPQSNKIAEGTQNNSTDQNTIAKRVEQSFVVTSGPSRVEGKTTQVGADICDAGSYSLTYTEQTTYTQTVQISQSAGEIFVSSVSYSVSVSDSTSKGTTVTEDIQSVCGGGCGHVTFTPYFQRVIGDFKPGGPFAYQRDTPETIEGGLQNGRYDVVCV